jgi:transposase
LRKLRSSRPQRCTSCAKRRRFYCPCCISLQQTAQVIGVCLGGVCQLRRRRFITGRFVGAAGAPAAARAQTPEHANGASGCRTSVIPKAIPWLKRSGKKLPEILSEIVQDWAAGKPVKLMLLNELSKRHPDEQIVMVMDGPGWHRSGMFKAPSHIGLLKLPPYAPQLNPIAHVWDELREKFFHNRVFDSLDALEDQLVLGLKTGEENPETVRTIVSWDWMVGSFITSFH